MKKYFFIIFILSCSLFANKELKILNWPEYIDINILQEFTSKTAISIKYDLYSNDTQMMQLITSDEQYDIAFPSSSFLNTMIKKDFLIPIENKKIKNHHQIDSYFLKDKTLQNYSVPYTWGTTGIIYNKNKIKINSFKDLWKKEFKSKIFILNDMNDMFAITLNVLNIDINTQNKEDIKKAFIKLKELIPNIKGFYLDSEKLNIELINETIYAALTYNGDIANIVKNKKFKFIHPLEGALLWVDTMVILKNSQNKDIAYKFIDYIISKDVAFKNYNEIGYAIPHKNFALNGGIYPNKEQRKKLKKVQTGDSNYIYIKYWNEFLKELEKKGINYE